MSRIRPSVVDDRRIAHRQGRRAGEDRRPQRLQLCEHGAGGQAEQAQGDLLHLVEALFSGIVEA